MTTLINIRGTSGSGKSTLIREIMGLYLNKIPFREEGRKQPIGYWLNHPRPNPVDGMLDLSIIGHYETACGGCDTIPNIDKIYELVRKAHRMGSSVLFEGLLLSAEVNRTVQLHTDGLPLLVIGLDTPLEECLASVNKRRQTAFEERLERIQAENAVKAEHGHKLIPLPEPKGDVNPKNTESKYKATVATMRRLQEAGVQAEWHSRESALVRLREVLKV